MRTIVLDMESKTAITSASGRSQLEKMAIDRCAAAGLHEIGVRSGPVMQWCSKGLRLGQF